LSSTRPTYFENLTDETRIILFCDFERPIRNPLMRAINRWAIAHVLPLTATKNVEGEEVGLANRVFGSVYAMRTPFRTFKKAHRGLYYTLKYATMVAALALLLLGSYRVLR
jgi:beta-hydroxylase